MCYAGIFLFFYLLNFTNCIFNVKFVKSSLIYKDKKFSILLFINQVGME